jgi:hypothetical protein
VYENKGPHDKLSCPSGDFFEGKFTDSLTNWGEYTLGRGEEGLLDNLHGRKNSDIMS